MNALAAWWRARTAREQLILRAAGIFVALVLTPIWAYLGAAAFRREAAAELAAARDVESQVAFLAEAARAQGPALQSVDPSVRGRAFAAADAAGLTVNRVEPIGPDRIRVAFAPSDSLSIYRWIDQVGASGVFVARTSIVRVGDSEQVEAEFELAGGP